MDVRLQVTLLSPNDERILAHLQHCPDCSCLDLRHEQSGTGDDEIHMARKGVVHGRSAAPIWHVNELDAGLLAEKLERQMAGVEEMRRRSLPAGGEERPPHSGTYL